MAYYQVANESRFNPAYVEKFKRVAEAVWKVAPDITLVTTSAGGYGGDDEATAREKLALHLDLLRFCHQHGKKVLIDSHSFKGAPDMPRFSGFARWIQRFAPDPKAVSVGVLELNAGAFDMARGLSHALELNAIHRYGDVLRGTGMPNVSQPWKVYQTDWKAVLWTQGNIYYTQDKVWCQPAYYVDQMIAQSWASAVVQSEVTAPPQTLDALAAKAADGSSLVLRVVNSSSQPVTARVKLSGFTPRLGDAVVQTLAHDDVLAYNSLEQPDRIRPVPSVWHHQGGSGTWVFPGNSFTLIQVK